MEGTKNFEGLLSSRILKNCWQLYLDKHHKHAAHEAMIQVELALKEKRIVEDKKFGKRLISSLFTKNDPQSQNMKLHVPLGEDLQEDAKALFKGVFAYYRNYTAHDGSKIDPRTCIRIMIIASELLDLIDASHLSFSDIGGVPGLIKNSIFQDEKNVTWLLDYLANFTILEQDYGALYEQLLENRGLNEQHVQALIDLDLIRYKENTIYPTNEEMQMGLTETDVGYFVLTDLGRQFIDAIQHSNSEDD